MFGPEENAMPPQIKVASVQMDLTLGEKDKNLARILESLEETAREGAVLTVFPECAVTGYCFESADEARPLAEPIPGPSTRRLAEACRDLKAFAIVGLIEADGPRFFNACALVGPDGVAAKYRKIHLPLLGLDRFAEPGNEPFAVHQAGPLRIGMSICYDGSFPESARVLALQGADLIALPTNWPTGSEPTACFVANTRALENHVYYMSANRVGIERGFRFIGGSRICHPDGRTLAEAPSDRDAVLYADVEPEVARRKHLVRIPGTREVHRLADRRPEMYGKILEPVDHSPSPRSRHGASRPESTGP
jgi:predicted amidohydrolase